MKRMISVILMTITAALFAAGNNAEKKDDARMAPRLLNYQGFLTDTLGNPITNPSVSMTFSIYDAISAGNQKWIETQGSVGVDKGIFHVLLGGVNPIPDSVFNAGIDRWLELSIAGQALSPRTRIVSVPYAYTATYSDTALYALRTNPDNDWLFRITDTADTTLQMGGRWGLARAGNTMYGNCDSTHVNLGVGCTTGASGQNYKYVTVGGGYNNTAVMSYSTVGGGVQNVSSGQCANVAGGSTNTASAECATVAGGNVNTAGNYNATVAGGQGNIASGYISTVGGGKVNRARGAYSVVSGGGGPSEADSNSAIGDRSAIGGGYSNVTSGFAATVAGGYWNYATNQFSTIAGGRLNNASGAFATVGGGHFNKARGAYSVVSGGGAPNESDSSSAIGDYSVIGGGLRNRLNGAYATIGGGFNNVANGYVGTVAGGSTNAASGYIATVGGGSENIASSFLTTVGGGWSNTASDTNAIVSGGYYNYAGGKYSAILGGYADTIFSTGDYSYLFGINSNLTQDSTFMVDMPHVWFGTEAAGYEFPYGRGTDGQVMKLNGSGVLSWGSIAYVDSARVAANAHKLQGKDTTDLNNSYVNEGQVNSIDSLMLQINSVTMPKIAQAGATTGQVIKWNGTAWQPAADSSMDNDWNYFVSDGADTTLQMGGRWGLARPGNVLFGNADSTHVNFGVACTTGTTGSNLKYSTIAGGLYNSATNRATVAGGQYNAARGEYAAVGGGSNNIASGWTSTISGGSTNIASNDYATVGGGYQNTASGLRSVVGGGYLNAASNQYATVSGGTTNTTGGNYATVGGGLQNSAIYMGTVAGGAWNNASTNATIAGGVYNSASGLTSTVSGGYQNLAAGTVSAVGGGRYNKARGAYSAVSGGGSATEADSNSAIGDYSAIGGGYRNYARGIASAIGGGYNNITSNNYTSIHGGYQNTVTNESGTVGGGYHNVASGWVASVAGGSTNTSSGFISAIGGGSENVANEHCATVSGGSRNIASDSNATVGGGYGNQAAGKYSAILGGYADSVAATGDYSYLFGINSNLTQDSTFMVDLPHIWFGTEASGYEFPYGRGANGQVMVTNGSGQLSWASTNDNDWIISGSDMYSAVSGNVGIGVVSPTTKLDVAGTVKIADGTQALGRVFTSDASGNGSWQALPTAPVTSVFGRTGTVVAASGDYTTTLVTEGTNLYFTDARAQAAITGGASSIATNNLTANRALLSDGSGKVTVSAATNTELGYLSGVTSAIQTQLSGKQAVITGGASSITSSNLTANRALLSDGSGKVAVSTATNTELGYLSGVTSAIQTQLNGKAPAASPTFTGDVTMPGSGIWNSSGNVGIGLTSPSAKLDVTGTVKIADGTQALGRVFTSDASGNGSWQAIPNDNDWTFRVTDTADTTLQMDGRWGLTRPGSTLYGNADSTHVNLGVGNTTGTSGQNRKYCTIAGGNNNTAGGDRATVGGGQANVASATVSTVSGGVNNIASGSTSFVGGGISNTANNGSTVVGGGDTNLANGSVAAILGGGQNTASGHYSTIGAGRNNTTNGYYNFVGGGFHNYANDSNSVVAGGYWNQAGAKYSAILGGIADTIFAGANYSYLFGINSNLTQDSTFMVDMPHVWFGTEAAGYEFPITDGTSGQALVTNGGGQVSWGTPATHATYTPTSSADANGNVGDIAWDDGYVYVKTSAGWKRSALSNW